jgi:hypothetical protein
MNSLNLFVLRRLFNPNHDGRGQQGTLRRKEFKVTIRPTTYLELRNLVPVGAGQYGSSVVELCIRSFLASMGATNLLQVAEELALAVTDRQQLASNLRNLANAIEDYNMARSPIQE